MSSLLLCRRYKALLFGVTNKYCCSILLVNIPALHSSVVDFESCQFGRFTGKKLTTTASRHGCSTRHRLCFVPSQHLKCLRSRRKRTRDPHLRKELNLQIRTSQKINASMEIGTAVPFFERFLAGGRTYNISCPKVLAALVSFALMKMILLACWQHFSKAYVYVKCQFHQYYFQSRFGPLMN